jgi:serine/threonine-protein kinase mTOR
MLNIIRTQAIDGLLEFYFQQLARVVNIMVQHMKHYMEDMIALVQQYWNSHTSPAIQSTIISLMEALACIPDVDFKPYIPRLLPDILDILEGDVSVTGTAAPSVNATQISSPATMIRTLQALAVFGIDMEEYLHLVLPVITKLFDDGNPLPLRKAAVGSVARLLERNVYLSDHASLIIQPLIRILHHPGPEFEASQMRDAAMETLVPLIKQMGITYRLFAPTVDKVF